LWPMDVAKSAMLADVRAIPESTHQVFTFECRFGATTLGSMTVDALREAPSAISGDGKLISSVFLLIGIELTGGASIRDWDQEAPEVIAKLREATRTTWLCHSMHERHKDHAVDRLRRLSLAVLVTMMPVWFGLPTRPMPVVPNVEIEISRKMLDAICFP
jgi:hypothetical protein